MATTMETVDNILKEVYEPRLRDQLQSEVIALKRLERSSEGITTDQVGGKYTRFPIRVTRNHGIGARGEMEALPEARTQGYESVQLKLKYLYGAAQLSGQTIKLAKTDVQTFTAALDLEINGLKETLVKDTNRQVYGTNRGVLATATGAGSTTTFVTDNVQYLEIGMLVDLWDSTDTDSSQQLNDASEVITDIEETSAGEWTVTFDGTVTSTATGDFLTRHDSRGNEKTGLAQILNFSEDYDELYGVEHPTWTANVDDSGGTITEGRMISMIDTIRRRGGSTTLILTSLGVRRAYFNLLVQQRRYTETKTFTGGFTGLAFTTDQGEVPLVSDFDNPPGIMHFLNEKELKLYEEGDWSFMDMDGSRWQRVINSSGRFDAYETMMYKYCELGTHRRNSHGAYTGLTEASS